MKGNATKQWGVLQKGRTNFTWHYNIDEFKGEKTIVLIAHRLSTVSITVGWMMKLESDE
tara:strand:+ start:125 stop:301 length:177 start_codon:yes stop_codon:yes gene_type:complete